MKSARGTNRFALLAVNSSTPPLKLTIWAGWSAEKPDASASPLDSKMPVPVFKVKEKRSGAINQGHHSAALDRQHAGMCWPT